MMGRRSWLRAGTTARASTSIAVATTLAGPEQSGLDGALSIRGIALHPPWKGRDGLRAGPRVSRGCDDITDCIDKRTQALHDPSDRGSPTSVVRVGTFQPVSSWVGKVLRGRRLAGSDRSSWIPAFAGMTAQSDPCFRRDDGAKRSLLSQG